MILNIILAFSWTQAGQLLLSLSILVILHEFGHYITARWFKVRVEKFYLFFDAWFSLFKKKIGETEYGIGWLPLGGYVKLAGMIDESMDKEQMKQPAQPWEFRTKPAWQRLIIMLGGIIMNVLVAFFIYAMILYKWGDDRVLNSSLKNGIWVTDSLMSNVGLRTGDKLVSVKGQPVESFDDAPLQVLLSGGGDIVVERGGAQKTIAVPKDLIGQLVDKKKERGAVFMPRYPAIMGAFAKDDTSNAKKAGLQEFDKVLKVDAVDVQFIDQMAVYLDTRKNQKVDLLVERKHDTISLPVMVNSNGRIGTPSLTGKQYDSLGVYKLEHTRYGFFESFPAGVNLTFKKLGEYWQQFKQILTPATGAAKGMGGFMSMGSVFPKTWNWEAFWNMTALFSIILAFMNLLPIPALDGGHVMFTLYEMIFRRKPSEKFMEYALIVGMVLLLGLMLYANGNDIYRWLKGYK